jgi:hypothetical protein
MIAPVKMCPDRIPKWALLRAPKIQEQNFPWLRPLIRRTKNLTLPMVTVALYADRGKICAALGFSTLSFAFALVGNM